MGRGRGVAAAFSTGGRTGTGGGATAAAADDDDAKARALRLAASHTPGKAERERAAVLAEVQAEAKLDHALAAAVAASAASARAAAASATNATGAGARPSRFGAHVAGAAAPAVATAAAGGVMGALEKALASSSSSSLSAAGSAGGSDGGSGAGAGGGIRRQPQTVEDILAAKAAGMAARLDSARAAAQAKAEAEARAKEQRKAAEEAAYEAELRRKVVMEEAVGGLERYAVAQQVGEGQYGVVSRAVDRRSGETVAIKELKYELETQGFDIRALRELMVLAKIQRLSRGCKNLVGIREILAGGGERLDKWYLVMEFCDMDLGQVLEYSQDSPLRPGQVKDAVRQLFTGLAVLHEHNFLHRDIKTINCLVSANGVMKLCDFGCARQHGEFCGRLTPNMVSGHYRAPELLLGLREYGGGVDVWAMGCLFAELLQREVLFRGENELDQLNKITSLLGHPAPEAWPEYDALYRAAFRRGVPARQAASAAAAAAAAEAPSPEEAAAAEEARFAAMFHDTVDRAGGGGGGGDDGADDGGDDGGTAAAGKREANDDGSSSASLAASMGIGDGASARRLPAHLVALRKRFSRYGYTGTGRLAGVLGRPIGFRRTLSSGSSSSSAAASPSARPSDTAAGKVTALAEGGFDLLSRCLTPNPARRVTASEALRHPWFADDSGGDAAERLEPALLQQLNAKHALKEQAKKHAAALANGGPAAGMALQRQQHPQFQQRLPPQPLALGAPRQPQQAFGLGGGGFRTGFVAGFPPPQPLHHQHHGGSSFVHMHQHHAHLHGPPPPQQMVVAMGGVGGAGAAGVMSYQRPPAGVITLGMMAMQAGGGGLMSGRSPGHPAGGNSAGSAQHAAARAAAAAAAAQLSK